MRVQHLSLSGTWFTYSCLPLNPPSCRVRRTRSILVESLATEKAPQKTTDINGVLWWKYSHLCNRSESRASNSAGLHKTVKSWITQTEFVFVLTSSKFMPCLGSRVMYVDMKKVGICDHICKNKYSTSVNQPKKCPPDHVYQVFYLKSCHTTPTTTFII